MNQKKKKKKKFPDSNWFLRNIWYEPIQTRASQLVTNTYNVDHKAKTKPRMAQNAKSLLTNDIQNSWLGY